nr:hypothetical protein Iba_chr07dCG5100 [Ipomoea batatas]
MRWARIGSSSSTPLLSKPISAFPLLQRPLIFGGLRTLEITRYYLANAELPCGTEQLGTPSFCRFVNITFGSPILSSRHCGFDITCKILVLQAAYGDTLEPRAAPKAIG